MTSEGARKQYRRGKKAELKEQINSCEEYLDGGRYTKKLKELKSERLKLKLLQYLKAFYPYIITTGVASLVLTGIIKNGHRYNLVTRETIDSFGNDKSMSKYTDEFDKDTGTISYISKWKLNKNKVYERTIRKYDINNIRPEIIKSIVSDEKTINSLDDMFGNPMSVEKETSRNLTKDEIKMSSHIEAVTYSKNDNDVLVTKFSASEKALYALTAIIILAGVNTVIDVNRYVENGYDLGKELIYIDDHYLEKLERLCLKEEKKTKKLKK